MSQPALSVASLLIALPSAVTGFVLPAFGPPPYYVAGMSDRVQLDRVELRPVLSRPGHRRFGTSWRRPMPPIGPLYSSADDQSQSPAAGGAGSDAIDQEIGKIKTARMTAGQIKAELDSMGVSYQGLLEKAEYVRALAEARVGGPSSPTSVDSSADGDEASRASQADGVGDADEATAAPAAAASGVRSPAPGDPQPEMEPAPEEEPESSAPVAAGDTPVEPAVQEEEMGAADDSGDAAPGEGKPGGFHDTAAASSSDSGTSEEHGRGSTPEDESVSIPGDERVQEQESVREDEPALKAPVRNEESGQAKAVDVDEPVVANPADVAQKRATTKPGEVKSDTVGAQTTSPSTSTPKDDRQDAVSTTTADATKEPVGDGLAVAQEVAKIREAGMTAGQIKKELDSLNVSYADLLEKSEFVQRLAEARTDPEKSTGANSGVPEPTPTTTEPGVAAVGGETGGTDSDPAAASGSREAGVGEGDKGNPSVDEEPTVVKVKVENESPPPADDEPVPVKVEKERAPPVEAPGAVQAEEINEKEVPAAGGGAAEGTGGNGDSEAVGGDREEVSGMRMSAIKKELDERRVSYAGLFEKNEFVDLLVDARVRGDTAPTSGSSGSGSDTSGGGGGGGVGGSTNTDFDPSYKNVEVKKMKNDNNPKQQQQQQQPGADGGMPGGGAGGFDINSILSGLGGTGGAAGPGGESPAGGFDINGILNLVGGMGTAQGGASPGSGGGIGGVGDMLSKLANNPSAMESFQRAQSNPKVLAAIQDIQKNGLSAMAKYSQDPEIMAVIDELKSVF